MLERPLAYYTLLEVATIQFQLQQLCKVDGRDTRIYTKRIVKGGLISENFSLWLHLQLCQITILLVYSLYMNIAQDIDYLFLADSSRDNDLAHFCLEMDKL